MVEPQKLVQQFVNDLSSLKTNDKFKIAALTLFAKDYKDNLPVVEGIVQACCDNVQSTTPNLKLTALYVIDSIVKNLPDRFIPLFSKRIADVFYIAFQKCRDVDLRKKLYKLRVTWQEIFPLCDLYELDLKVRSEDIGWPKLIPIADDRPLIKSLSNVAKIPKVKHLNVQAAPPPLNSTPPSVDAITVSIDRDPRLKLKEQEKSKKKKDKEDEFLIDRSGDREMESIARKRGRKEFFSLNSQKNSKSIPEVSSPLIDVDMRISNVSAPLENQHPPYRHEERPHFHLPPYARPPRPRLHPMMRIPPIDGPDWNVEIPDFPEPVQIGVDPRMLSLVRNPKPIKTITIDGQPYCLLLDRVQPLIRVEETDTIHAVRFRCQSVDILINERKYTIPGTGFKTIKINSGMSIVYLGGPGHELVIDGQPHTVAMSSISVTYISHKSRSIPVKFVGPLPTNVNVLPAIPMHFLKWAAMSLFGHPYNLSRPCKNPLVALYGRNQSEPIEEASQEPEKPQVDIHDLYSKLVAAGFVSGQDKKDSLPTTQDLPDILKYSFDTFQILYSPELESLFDGYQCILCGLRFVNENCPSYANHLDYHYIKKSHDNDEPIRNHNWYQDSTYWLLGENSNVDQVNNIEASVIEQKEVKKCSAFSDPAKNMCAVCLEKLESYFDAVDGEWMLKDAILADGKIYHSICLDDAGKQFSASFSREVSLKPSEGGFDSDEVDDLNPVEIDDGEAIANPGLDILEECKTEEPTNFSYIDEPYLKRDSENVFGPGSGDEDVTPSKLPRLQIKYDEDTITNKKEEESDHDTTNILTPGTISSDPLLALRRALNLPSV